jgi:hypothetical protein
MARSETAVSTEQAKRKADERSQNMPSKVLLREAAIAGDEPHQHCSGCDRAFEKNDIRIRYPHVVPIRTVCESCIAKSEVLDKLGVSSPALTVIPTDSVPFAWFPDNPLVVAERQCPRCQSRHKESSDENGGDGMNVDMDTFGTTARFRMLYIENGSMRWVDGKMVHWTCKKCKENKEEVCDVSPTSFHPIKISDPAWPEALHGKEYLFAYYDIACRRVPRDILSCCESLGLSFIATS